MANPASRGHCNYCQRRFAKSGMTRHLQSCSKRAEAARAHRGQANLLHVLIEGRYHPEYWMHIEIPASYTLEDLDAFLRAIWLECCGHLSAFRIGAVSYTGYVDGFAPMWSRFEEKLMAGVRLGKALVPDQRIQYEYDFGSTTDLVIRRVGERKGQIGDQPIRILARNDAPTIPCAVCGKPATTICGNCAWGNDGWLCDDCLATHACGDEFAMRIVNSPRTGVCGYTGPMIDESQFNIV